MGSSGTNRFSDYPGSSDFSSNTGGKEKNNQCDKAIGNIELEDIAFCDFYINHKSLPKVNSDIRLRRALLGGRLVAETITGEAVGLLPTRFNYLLNCMEQGYTYFGNVTASRLQPLQYVVIDLAPAI